jgi:hypothetical protein
MLEDGEDGSSKVRVRLYDVDGLAYDDCEACLDERKSDTRKP